MYVPCWLHATLAQNQSVTVLCKTAVRVLEKLYCLLMNIKYKVVSYCWKICIYNLSDRFTTAEMKGKVLRWASLQCSHLLQLMYNEQEWGGCEKAARRRRGGPGVPVPSREGWAMPLWVPLRPTVDKTSTTTPTILLYTVKFFITFFGQESTLFFFPHKVSHNYPHTSPAQ